MDFQEFQQNLDYKWQRAIVKYSFVGYFIILLLEGLSVINGLIFEVGYSIVKDIGLRDVIVLDAIILLSSIATGMIVQMEKYSTKYKNYAVCMNVFIMTMMFSLAYNYYEVLMVMPAVAILISAVFVDNHITGLIYLLSNISVILSTVMALMGVTEAKIINDRLSGTFMAGIILLVAFVVAKRLAAYQQEQLDYMYDNYVRQQELIAEMRIEPLTRLLNRKALSESIQLDIANATENKGQYWLAILDLDKFKGVNDTYGHIAGDTVLKILAEILGKLTVNIASAYRYGGEEFVLLFGESDLTTVQRTCEAIRAAFEKSKFAFDEQLRITLSVGIAMYEDAWDSKMWINAADEALYRAKMRGRDCIVTYRNYTVSY